MAGHTHHPQASHVQQPVLFRPCAAAPARSGEEGSTSKHLYSPDCTHRTAPIGAEARVAEDQKLSTKIVDTFGSTVSDMVDTKPKLARNLLLRAFEVKRFQTRRLPEAQQLPSGRAAARIALEGVTGALEHPDEAVLTSIFLPTELFLAMGLRPLASEALADFVTGARAEEGLVRSAEQRGIPETYCSFHKILLGAAAARVLAPPRLIANCSVACDANNTTFKWLAQELSSPHVYVDVPYEYDEDACSYVADQLRELARAAEETFGRALDEGLLREHVTHTQATLDAMVRSLPLRRGRYLHNDMGLEMQQALALHLSLGSTDSLKMSQQALRDLQRAGRFDGLSLVWAHVAPFFSPSLQQMLDMNREAQIVTSDMCFNQASFDAFERDAAGRLVLDAAGSPRPRPGAKPWTHDASEPWEAMAERLIKNTFNGPAHRRIQRLHDLAQLAAADGVVCFCHWGCKETMGASQLAKRELEAAGIPVLVLDGDGCHRANNAEGQSSTRMGAFLEMLRARKGEVAGA